MENSSSPLRAVVTGATGAVGSSLVRELLRSPRWSEVTILVRRPFAFEGSGTEKLKTRVIDFEALHEETAAAARGYDAAFFTLGVGQPRKMNRDEVWKIDVEYARAFARGARDAGVSHISLLSSVGADGNSSAFYLKLKGAAETAISEGGIARTSLFRPSLLVTKEIRYGLQDRLTQALFPLAAPFMPRRFHQIRVEDLGKAMRINAEQPAKESIEVLDYPAFVKLLRSE